jgi:ethanolamine utilization microcompartment shell protein EutL
VKSRVSLIAWGLALALLVASTAGAVSDFDDDSDDGDVAADVSDVVTMAAPPALAEYAPAFGAVLEGDAPACNTGREIAVRIFRPPI